MPRRLTVGLTAAAVTAAAAATAAITALLAQAVPSPAQTIELAMLERAALESAPPIVEARALLAAARALLPAAEAPRDPALELWARNLLVDDGGAGAAGADGADRQAGSRPIELEVDLVQPVRFPGKRAAARAVAAAEAARAAAELEVATRRRIGEIRLAFAEIVATDREQRALAEVHDLLELVVETARIALETGEGSSLAVLEAELAVDEHDLEVDAVWARYLTLRSRLAELANLESKKLPFLVGPLPVPPLPDGDAPMPVDPEAPGLVLARSRLALAERQRDAAHQELKPDFGVGAGFSWPEGDSPALTARFGMSLPFFRRRRLEPALAAADARVDAARAAVRAEELATAERAERLAAERKRIDRARVRLSGAVIPRTSAAFDAARVAFIEGRVPLSRLLELLNDGYHARVELARAESTRFTIWAEWQEIAPPEFAVLAPLAPTSEETSQ